MNKPEISIKPFDPKAFAELMMNPNVKIVGYGGFDLSEPEESHHEAKRRKHRKKHNKK